MQPAYHLRFPNRDRKLMVVSRFSSFLMIAAATLLDEGTTKAKEAVVLSTETTTLT